MKKMLEKKENFPYFDAHFHYKCCIDEKCYENLPDYYGCSCAHSIEEWQIQSLCNENIILSFGLHPQSAGFINIEENADFLEKLLQENKIKAIGEAGFDFFTEEYKNTKILQEKMWQVQMELALEYNRPIVVHCRKANEKLFEYAKELKKLPSVLFHSFMGTDLEAKSLLNKGINGFFSFGKQLMNNNKKVISCVKNLPLENLLMETDAPFQFLKNEKFTCNGDIKKVYAAAVLVRNEDEMQFLNKMKENYENMFGLRN